MRVQDPLSVGPPGPPESAPRWILPEGRRRVAPTPTGPPCLFFVCLFFRVVFSFCLLFLLLFCSSFFILFCCCRVIFSCFVLSFFLFFCFFFYVSSVFPFLLCFFSCCSLAVRSRTPLWRFICLFRLLGNKNEKTRTT